MTHPLLIRCELVGTGWLSCVVSFEDCRAELSASYLSDALGNMLLFALAVSAGFRSVSFGMDEEPGEYRWVAELVEPNWLNLRILQFGQLWGSEPNSAGRLLFEAKVRPVILAEAIAEAAERVLQAHGLAGYAERWSEHKFPERELALLRYSIARWQQ
jgi:hypothetical protein